MFHCQIEITILIKYFKRYLVLLFPIALQKGLIIKQDVSLSLLLERKLTIILNMHSMLRKFANSVHRTKLS